MKLIDWLTERLENCHRIAATKKGADRDGWLEDAAYFQLAVTALAGAGQRYSVEPGILGSWEVFDNAPHKSLRNRWSTEKDARAEAARLNSTPA